MAILSLAEEVVKGEIGSIHAFIRENIWGNKCFRLLQALELNSIAFPCIGAGLAHIPLKKVAEVMAEAISTNLCRTQRPYEIEIYLYGRNHVMTEMDYIDMFENLLILIDFKCYIDFIFQKPVAHSKKKDATDCKQ